MYVVLTVFALLLDGCNGFPYDIYVAAIRTTNAPNIKGIRTRRYSKTVTPPATRHGQKQPAVLKTPPSVPSLPLVGSLPLIGMGKAANLGPPPHVQMARLASVYGDVMELRMGREPWIILSSPQAVHEAFVTRGSDFGGRPMVPSMGISSGGGQGFAQSRLTPELKKLRRAAFGDLFGKERVEQSRVELEVEAGLLAEHLVRETKRARGKGVEIRPALRRLVTNFVLGYVFSVRVPYASEPGYGGQMGYNNEDCDLPPVRLLEELVDTTDKLWSQLTSTQTTMADLLAPDVTTPSYSLRRLVKRRDQILRDLVAHRKRIVHSTLSSPTRRSDMLDALLSAGLTDAEIHYTLVDLFVAGINTVSTQIEWYVLLLAKHPEVRDRAYADAVSSDTTAGAYTHAVINEVLRAKPPLLLPRQTTTDTSVAGYAVPAGTTVLANNYALTHDPSLWRNPDQFRPERWLEEEAGLASGSAGVESCKFIPYSVGRRVCPGSRLADAEVKVATEVLLRRLRWKSVGGNPIDLGEDYRLTLSPIISQSLCFEFINS